MKKILCVLIAIICAFGTMSLIGCGDGDKGKIAKVWCTLASETYMQDQKPSSYPEAKLEVIAMKGETESRQVMITANKFIRGFTFETQDLVAEDGSKITKDNVKLYGEHYVEVRGNTNASMFSPAGYKKHYQKL